MRFLSSYESVLATPELVKMGPRLNLKKKLQDYFHMDSNFLHCALCIVFFVYLYMVVTIDVVNNAYI